MIVRYTGLRVTSYGKSLVVGSGPIRAPNLFEEFFILDLFHSFTIKKILNIFLVATYTSGVNPLC